MTLHLFRVVFAGPRPDGTCGELNVLALDMTSAIAAAVQHRGDANYLGVVGAMRLIGVDTVAANVRADFAKAHALLGAEVLS